MFVGWSTGPRNGSSAVGTVTLVVVGLNFGPVGFVGVVDRVVKSDDFGVVGAVVVVEVVQAHVGAVNAGVDDGDGDA